MADKRITALTELTYANMAAADALAIEDIDAGTTKKAELADLKQYMLGNATIGGSGAGDIATIDGAQTLTNKTLTSPNVNEAVALTSTASELNILHGATLSTAELNVLDGIPATLTATELGYVDGVTSAIQTQLNALAAAVATTAKTYTYVKEWTESGTSEAITEATINTACSVPTGYYVLHQSIVPALYSLSGGTYTLVVDPDITMTKTNIGGGVYGLDTLTVGSITSGDYCLALSFKVVASGA